MQTKYRKNSPLNWALSLFVLSQLALPAFAQVRLTGAAALAALLTPKKDAIQSTSGQKLEITGKNASIGLSDLVSGKADIGMVTGSLAGAVASADAEKPGSIRIQDFRAFEVGFDPVAFVVNPANPVESLTLDQIKNILTGNISNWKELGGNNAAIKVVACGLGNGPRIAVNEKLLAGAELVKDAIVRVTPKDISPIVAQMPEAIGFLGTANLSSGVKVIKTDRPLPMPLLLVTKGDPTAEQKKLIETVQSVLTKTP